MPVAQATAHRDDHNLGLRRGGDGWIRLTEEPLRPRTRESKPTAPETAPVRPASFASDRGFPKVELLRSRHALLVRAALPGVREENLRVRLEESDLVIEGELRPLGDEVGSRALISEWTYGPFHRRIQLGLSLAPTAMRSELREGLLRVEIELASQTRAAGENRFEPAARVG